MRTYLKPQQYALVLFLSLLLIFATTPMTQADTLTQDSVVFAWGLNNFGQIAVPAHLTDIVAVAGGWYHSVALRADGTVVAWGLNDHGESTVPTGLTGVKAVAAGWHHTVALKTDGTVVAWGMNAHGQTDIPAGLTGVMAIAAGWLNTVALKNDGTVVAWGSNGYGESMVPTGLTNVTAIATNWAHVLALKSDGTVVAWGIDAVQTKVPASLTNVIAIAAGGVHSVALKRNGAIVVWGENNYGQLDVPSGLAGVTAIATGRWHTLALKSDGSLIAWGLNSSGQSNVPAKLPGVSVVAGGGEHSLVITEAANLLHNPGFESGVWGWSFYTNGQGVLSNDSPGYQGVAAGRIDIDAPGTNVQLYQTGFWLEPNTRYRLQFAAKSNRGQDLSIALRRDNDPFTNYGINNFRVNLTTGWKSFKVEFTTKGFTAPTSDTRLRFWLAPFDAAGDVYWLDKVSLGKVMPTTSAAEVLSLVSGNVTGLVQGSGEAVMVTLVDLDSGGAAFQSTAITDATGAFAFTNVPQGVYELHISPPTGYLAPEVVQFAVSEEPNEDFIFTLESTTNSVYLPLLLTK